MLPCRHCCAEDRLLKFNRIHSRMRGCIWISDPLSEKLAKLWSHFVLTGHRCVKAIIQRQLRTPDKLTRGPAIRPSTNDTLNPHNRRHGCRQGDASDDLANARPCDRANRHIGPPPPTTGEWPLSRISLQPSGLVSQEPRPTSPPGRRRRAWRRSRGDLTS
jgi:hypothetical protein